MKILNKIKNLITSQNKGLAPYQVFFQKNFGSGFTILETLIAMIIFSSVIVAMIVVSGQGIQNINSVKNKMIATYLAEEGIEIVHNIRDVHIADGYPWVEFRDKCLQTSCVVDPIRIMIGRLIPCQLSSCPVLAYNSDGFYTYSSSLSRIPPSPFTREINFEFVTEDEIRVLSTVTWKNGISEQSVMFQESLFNWAGL